MAGPFDTFPKTEPKSNWALLPILIFLGSLLDTLFVIRELTQPPCCLTRHIVTVTTAVVFRNWILFTLLLPFLAASKIGWSLQTHIQQHFGKSTKTWTQTVLSVFIWANLITSLWCKSEPMQHWVRIQQGQKMKTFGKLSVIHSGLCHFRLLCFQPRKLFSDTSALNTPQKQHA